ncbi:MAG: TIGR04211 family SH3 domain-containing protein [Gammaproteobacteria bacterium]|nr:TIGR04211 family SH3 domain-containing protein [Gammaproteobacteria bacterium]
MKPRHVALFSSLLFLSPLGLTAPAYVQDEITVMVRSGDTLQHQIIKTIKSGAAVEVLENREASGYSRVRLQDGTEGWVITRYLSPTPAARELLKQAQQQIAQLKQENTQLKQQLSSAEGDRRSLGSDSDRLKDDNQKLNLELTNLRNLSSNVIALEENNQKMKADMMTLETKMQTLEQENHLLQDRRTRNWFIIGFGVAFLGLLVGLLIPRIRWRRKSSWSEL